MKKFSKERIIEEMNEAKNKYYFFSIFGIIASAYLGYIFGICVIGANTIEYRNYCLFERNLTGIIISSILIVVGFLGYYYFNTKYKRWKNKL